MKKLQLSDDARRKFDVVLTVLQIISEAMMLTILTKRLIDMTESK